MTGPLLTPEFGLPDELRAEIDQSVRTFEEQWGAMKALAKANGWLEKYRIEITARVSSAYRKGLEVGNQPPPAEYPFT
jgi:hypothetical protein